MAQGSKERQKFQCMICAYQNMYSPRNRDGICEVCVEESKHHRERIKAKIAERRRDMGIHIGFVTGSRWIGVSEDLLYFEEGKVYTLTDIKDRVQQVILDAASARDTVEVKAFLKECEAKAFLKECEALWSERKFGDEDGMTVLISY